VKNFYFLKKKSKNLEIDTCHPFNVVIVSLTERLYCIKFPKHMTKLREEKIVEPNQYFATKIEKNIIKPKFFNIIKVKKVIFNEF